MDALLTSKAEEKGVYEAGADGFDISEPPKESDPEEMTENTPETRQEVIISWCLCSQRLLILNLYSTA